MRCVFLRSKKVIVALLAVVVFMGVTAGAFMWMQYKTIRRIDAVSKQVQDINYEPVSFSENQEPTFSSEFPGAHNMMEYMKNNDGENLYKKLISGLDEESVKTVNQILYRFQQKDSNGTNSGFTSKELKQLFDLKRNFKVLKLSDNCFAWNDYLLPINHFEASVFFYQNGITNIKDTDKLKNKDIVDVGGFVGDSALIFSKYTNKKVYSFEPSSLNFDLMQKTVSMNNKKNIVPVKLGLGSKNQEAQIPIDISSGLKTDQTSEEKYSSIESETIKITTLDQYVSENKIDIGLIKVDIEGNEQDFLKGAENTIKTQKPFLLLSIYHNPSDFFNIKPMIESWGLGYDFSIVKCVDGQICAETLLIACPK